MKQYILVNEIDDAVGCDVFNEKPKEAAIEFIFDNDADAGRGTVTSYYKGKELFMRHMRPSSFGPGLSDYMNGDALTLGDIRDAAREYHKLSKVD